MDFNWKISKNKCVDHQLEKAGQQLIDEFGKSIEQIQKLKLQQQKNSEKSQTYREFDSFQSTEYQRAIKRKVTARRQPVESFGRNVFLRDLQGSETALGNLRQHAICTMTSSAVRFLQPNIVPHRSVPNCWFEFACCTGGLVLLGEISTWRFPNEKLWPQRSFN